MKSSDKSTEPDFLSDINITHTMGKLLRAGVVTAAALIFLGAVLYLFRYGLKTPDYSTFIGEPEEFTSVKGILKSVLELRSRGIIMLGLVILIFTPIARVVFSLIAFTLQKDFTYSIITTVVLIIILLSFLGII